MRRLLSAIVALVLAGGIAWCANIPLFSGPSCAESSQLQSCLNQLILQINPGVPSVLSYIPGPITSTATTAEQTLASATIPTGTFTSFVGSGVVERCSGGSGSNTNTKTMHLYFGTGAELSSAAFSTSAETWDLELLVLNNTTPVASTASYTGRGTTNTTVVAPITGVDTSDLLSGAVTAKCTVTQGTASAADITLDTFLITTVK